MLKKMKKQGWPGLQALVCLGMLAFSMLGFVAQDIWSSLYSVYYMTAMPILIAFYFYFRRLRDGIEIKLFLAFCLWLVLTRILLGDESLQRHQLFLLGMFANFLLLGAGPALPGKWRLRFLDAMAGLLCFFFTLLAVGALFYVITGTKLIHPMTGTVLYDFYGSNWRLSVLLQNSNVGGSWFMGGSLFLLYLFFRYRKLPLRILCLLSLMLNLLCLSLTDSRNASLCLSICAALFVFCLALPVLRKKKCWLRLLCLMLALILLVPISYTALGMLSPVVGKAAEVCQGTLPEMIDQKATDKAGETVTQSFDKDRGYGNNGRMNIYKLGLENLKRDPQRLMIGCHTDEVMSWVNTQTSKPYGHLHCSYLQLLHYVGIPGLLLALSLLFVLLYKGAKLVLLYEGADRMALCCLILYLIAIMGWNVLERSLFWNNDLLPILFFTSAGVVAAEYKERLAK